MITRDAKNNEPNGRKRVPGGKGDKGRRARQGRSARS